MTQAISKPVQSRSRQTRESLIDALEVLLRSKSIHELTINEIVTEAGVTTGAMYRWFDDKRTLLRAAAERFSEKTPTLPPLSEEEKLKDHETIIREAIHGTISYTLDNIPLMRAAAAYDDLPSYQSLQKARTTVANRVASLLCSSSLKEELLTQRAHFALRMVTAVARDTFMSGPAAMDTTISRKVFEKKNMTFINDLVEHLVKLITPYIEQP